MPETFDLAHAFTAKWEGSLTDHPADTGGITNYGVSISFLRDYAAKNQDTRDWLDRIGVILPVTPDTIRNLTKDHARVIFKRVFWDAPRLDELPRLTAIAVYDANVNCGDGQSTKFLQRACNTLPGDKLVVDGAIGPKTRARANAITPDALLAGLCINERDSFYHALVDSKPSQSVFLKGWLGRDADLRTYIHDLGVA